MNNLVAVIPVRKGSQRVINKNFKKFADENLLIKKIKILKKVEHLDKIIINTDSNDAIDIAKNYGVDYWRREDYFASSECLNSDFWQNVAKTTDSKYLLFANCTSPLIKLETYQNTINIFKKKIINGEFDSLNSVTELKEFIFLDNKPINFNLNTTPNSQDLPNTVILNFAINILSTKNMYNEKSLIGKKPYLYKLNEVEGIDINSETDFEIAEFFYKKINKISEKK